MGGFLNALSFLAPIGESIGGTMHQADVRQQQQQQRDAYGKLLQGLGPEYQGVQEAFKAGASIHDITGFLGGPLGKELQDRHRSEQLAQIFQNPEDYRDPVKLRQAALQNLLPEGVEAKFFGEGDTPKSEYERYIKDQLGMSLEGYRALPQEVRDKDYQGFLDQTKKKQGAQPIGGGSTGDPGVDAWLAKNPAYRGEPLDKVLAQYKKETSLTTQEKGVLDDARAAIPRLEHVKELAKGILPMESGPSVLGSRIDRWKRGEFGDPKISEFEQAKSVEIELVKSMAGTTRISQYELTKAVGGIEGANTYPAFEKAVDDAINALQIRIGVINYRSMGPMGDNEATWSGTGYDGALNSATEGGSTGFESEP